MTVQILAGTRFPGLKSSSQPDFCGRPLFSAGFTLAELLIALLIVGEIATFTIPKVLSGQQNARQNAITKEALAMVANAYAMFKQSHQPDANTSTLDLTPYMNYVSAERSARTIDLYSGAGSTSCTIATDPDKICLTLANGSVIKYATTQGGWDADVPFGGTGTTNAMWFDFDPDGSYSGGTTGPGKGVRIFLYYSGRVTTYGGIDANTTSGMSAGNVSQPDPTKDPSWLTW